MTNPNFDAMDLTELKTYVSSHTQDNEAFYALADRVYASPQKTLTSPEDLEQLPEVQRARQKRMNKQESEQS
jgi:hypothetical protein